MTPSDFACLGVAKCTSEALEEAGAKMILRLCVAEDPKREYLMEMMQWRLSTKIGPPQM